MDVNEQIEVFKEFIEIHCKGQLYALIQEGRTSLIVSFKDLVNYNHALADLLLDEPEDTLKNIVLAISQFDFLSGVKNIVIRFKDLPDTQKVRISDIRSSHLGSFLYIEGIVRQASDVRPQVTNAKFECAGCSNTLSILQIDTKFKEPTRCTCGWRGKFRLISKDLIDVQHLKIEETSENLEGGEQPKRLSVLLEQDLVDPKMERRTTPGSKVRIFGIVKEVPIQLKSGAQSIRYDLILEANNIEPIQEDYSDLILTSEDVEKIKLFSKDGNVFEKFVKSIAPSIYGHEKIKEALVLQLMGGLRNPKPDGTTTRGDIHILLVGDPGCIAGDSQVALPYKGMEKIQDLGTTHLQPLKEVVTKIRRDAYDKPYDFATVFQKYEKQPVLKILTETGKEIVCTFNQPFLTKEGWKRADELLLDTKIRVMPKIPNYLKDLAQTGFTSVEKTSGPLKEVSLPEFFTKDLAALCGYVLGDGHVRSNGYSVTCYVNDEETDLIEPLKNFWKETFNVEPRYFVTNEIPQEKIISNSQGMVRILITTQKLHHLEINSKQINSCLSFLAHKRVPQQLFQSPKKVIAPFLAWLFEADGCAFGNGRGRTALQLKSVHPALLRDVQLLLLYFGIHSRIGNDNLYIRRAFDMELFIKYIGFVSEKKKKKLEDVLAVNLLRTQRRKGYQRWEKIKSIEPFGVLDVYDFEVPVSHSFIANGILCHNSGKSQMLQFISKAAPKARFVSGKGASVDYNEPLLLREHGEIKLVKIGEFVDAHSQGLVDAFVDLDTSLEALSVNLITKKLAWNKIQSVYRHKISDKLLKFTLESGRQVSVTKDHSIFILEQGKLIVKKASELKLKDCAIAPAKIPLFDQENDFNSELARLLGYYIAEGHMRCTDSSYKIEFTLHRNEINIIQDIKNISKMHLGNEARDYSHGENGVRVIIYGKEAYLKFAELLGDVVHKKALTKRIPKLIFNSSLACRNEFIKGYLLGDAGVTKSKELMSDLLYLYLQNDILASCNSRLEDGEVEIKGRKIKMTGYRYDLKSPHPDKIYKNRYRNPPYESLPSELLHYFFKDKISSEYSRMNLARIGNKTFFERLKFIGTTSSSGSEVRTQFGESVLEYFKDNEKIFTKIKNGRTCLIELTDYGKQLMKQLLDFKTLMQGDLGFVRIKKIEEVDSTSEYVYDISVPEHENFIGGFGGVLLHNSGAGLCVAPDSLVVTNPGGIHKIKDIVEENLINNAQPYQEGIWNSSQPTTDKKIFTLDSNLKIKPKEINQLWRISPPEYMLKLITSSGKEVLVTQHTKLYASDLTWKEALIFKEGDYLATTRTLDFDQTTSPVLTINLLTSNPVVLNVKDKVKFIIEEACRKKGIDKRTLAKNLKLSELSIYHHWVNPKARGNIKLNTLKLLSDYAEISMDTIINEFTSYSLYNGKPIKLPKYFNEDLLYFAGLIAGDGDLSKQKNTVSIRFSNNSPHLIHHFLKMSKDLFDINPYISSLKSEKRVESWRFCSKLVFEVLVSLGLCLSPKSHKIDMSNLLLKLPNKLLAHYLRGYYDTDGGPVERKTKGSNSIESSSTSKVFSEKLKLILLRYSLKSKIRKKWHIPNEKIQSNYDKYVVTLTSKESLLRFRETIGFNHPDKKEKLNRIINSVSKEDTNLDIIPHARELLTVIEHDLNINILTKRTDSSGISRTYLKNILDSLKDYTHPSLTTLNLLADSDLFWEKILKIEFIKDHGYEYVYDLTVEDSHNFIVNGILVHNTAAVVKDEFLRGWSLEAGALPLANKGICVVDELDKIDKEDTAALHSAMEQQIIPISKANIQATLTCETTLLAAANPKFGRFDPYTPIASQIDLPSTLINRFDLIFPVRDIPSKDRDEMIALHVLETSQTAEAYQTEVTVEFLRKYVAYSKKNLKPKLTKPAVHEIKDFYVQLRNSGKADEGGVRPIPISARQLEGLVRLATASARIRLDDKITKEDARRAIELLSYCLMQVGFDPETGQIDIDRMSSGISASTRNKIIVVKEIIAHLQSKGLKEIPLDDIMMEAASRGIEEGKVEEALSQLKKSGDIFEPRRNFIAKVG